MSGRKPWAPDLPSTSAEFSANGRLPTEEETQQAMEKSFRDVIREDLHRDIAYQPPAVGGHRAAGSNGWLAEVPIGAPEGISLIDRIVDAALPQPPNVALRGVDPKRVKAKLDDALAKGRITQQQMDAVLSSLPVADDAA